MQGRWVLSGIRGFPESHTALSLGAVHPSAFTQSSLEIVSSLTQDTVYCPKNVMVDFFFVNNYFEKFSLLEQGTNDSSIYLINTHGAFYVPRLFNVHYKYECASNLQQC